MTTLAELAVGQTAKVVEILGDDSIALRLMEMGIIEQEPIKLIGRAPLGDPLEIQVRGYRLSLRTTEAQRIQVSF
ncbi:MAG: ferrous iron transport protein A [Pirellulaceae bacterium]